MFMTFMFDTFGKNGKLYIKYPHKYVNDSILYYQLFEYEVKMRKRLFLLGSSNKNDVKYLNILSVLFLLLTEIITCENCFVQCEYEIVVRILEIPANMIFVKCNVH